MIFHIDGDAFFASCEQAVHPELRGKPVITGAERGIVSAASYEAKRLGVSRGVPLWEVKKRIPEAVIVASDYELYGMFSNRMFAIIRRWIDEVEEYSIDEAFGKGGYSLAECFARARHVCDDIYQLLGITVSIGIAQTKVLAKVGSKWEKPAGITACTETNRVAYLDKTHVGNIWGIGPATTSKLEHIGISTALEFSLLPLRVIATLFSRPIQDVWQELNGHQVFSVETTPSHKAHSIQKVKTFSPSSSDRGYILSQLFGNLENACIRARRHHLSPSVVGVYLRRADFRSQYDEARLPFQTASPIDIAPLVEKLFSQLIRASEQYRASGIVLACLKGEQAYQQSLFLYERVAHERSHRLFQSIDALDERYGKHTVQLGRSFIARKKGSHEGVRNVKPIRSTIRLFGETVRQRLSYPFFYVRV